MTKIATVTGEISSSDLGKTLMHEHLVIGFPGFESHTTASTSTAEERLSICVDKIQSLQDLGFSTLLDPCPNDLGREPETAAKAAQKTGFNVICATGLYLERMGGAPYWKLRAGFGPPTDAMAEVFIKELTEGIGDTGIRAGIIKVATGEGEVTDYEQTVLEAAAKASVETGAPITTHTENGTMGDAQQRILTEHGVPANRIIIGHSCGTDDHAYHMQIARGGSYLGFDRFGIEAFMPDEKRVASLAKLIRAGAGDRVVVSHDSVWCWRGEPFPPRIVPKLKDIFPEPTHFSRVIVPMLLEAGVTQEEIDRLLIDNPRRFFDAEKLDALA